MTPDAKGLGITRRNHGSPEIHIVWIGRVGIMAPHAGKIFLLAPETLGICGKFYLRRGDAAWMGAFHGHGTIPQSIGLFGMAGHADGVNPPQRFTRPRIDGSDVSLGGKQPGSNSRMGTVTQGALLVAFTCKYEDGDQHENQNNDTQGIFLHPLHLLSRVNEQL